MLHLSCHVHPGHRPVRHGSRGARRTDLSLLFILAAAYISSTCSRDSVARIGSILTSILLPTVSIISATASRQRSWTRHTTLHGTSRQVRTRHSHKAIIIRQQACLTSRTAAVLGHEPLHARHGPRSSRIVASRMRNTCKTLITRALVSPSWPST